MNGLPTEPVSQGARKLKGQYEETGITTLAFADDIAILCDLSAVE